MTKPLLESGLFLSLVSQRCIAIEGRGASSRERLRHRALLSPLGRTICATPHTTEAPQKPRRMHKVKRNGEWRTPTTRGGWRRESARGGEGRGSGGEGCSSRRPGCAASLHGILRRYKRPGSLFLSRDSRRRENARKRAAHAERVKRWEGYRGRRKETWDQIRERRKR